MTTSNSSENILAVGIMTGNSLDGADCVLAEFSTDNRGAPSLRSMLDLCHHFKSMPAELNSALRALRDCVIKNDGDVAKAEIEFNAIAQNKPLHCGNFSDFSSVSEGYTNFVASAVNELLTKARSDNNLRSTYNLENIDIVGFHGQTCAHLPRSIAGGAGQANTYTVQLGNGQALADIIGIPVVHDFRSDDLVHGGEAAPLAPMHHLHLAQQLKQKGIFPLAFVNGGNSGNLTLISQDSSGKDIFLGWDSGPCNDFPDKMMVAGHGMLCDRDGLIGAKGKVQIEIIRLLFDSAVITGKGDNFLLQPPPKSSDPQWYRLPSELINGSPISGKSYSFEDRLRSCEYFAAYCLFHSLAMVADKMAIPSHYLLCGGAWKNPVIKGHLIGLIAGDFLSNPVLPEHISNFEALASKIAAAGKTYCEISDSFGINSDAMEARVFADAAVCRVLGIPFTVPEMTGVSQPCLLGMIKFPNGDSKLASSRIRELMEKDKTDILSLSPVSADWNRATAAWGARIKS